MDEFKETPSSQLTIDEFQKIDLEEEQDPPSFTQAKKRVKQQSEDLNNPEIASELEIFQKEIENLLAPTTTGNTELASEVLTEGGSENGSSMTEKDTNASDHSDVAVTKILDSGISCSLVFRSSLLCPLLFCLFVCLFVCLSVLYGLWSCFALSCLVSRFVLSFFVF